jgi:hypothetical protein
MRNLKMPNENQEFHEPIEPEANRLTTMAIVMGLARMVMGPTPPSIRSGSTYGTDAEPLGVPMNARRRRLYDAAKLEVEAAQGIIDLREI